MTAQIGEVLILDGEELEMAFCPPLPDSDPRIQPADEADEDAPSILRSFACWRGYRGTWEIKSGRFYLVKLQGCMHLVRREPLFADWFTGVLRIPRGELLEYVHMGFGSLYKEELHIKIDKGVVVKSRVIENRGKKIERWTQGLKNLPGGENDFDGDDW